MGLKTEVRLDFAGERRSFNLSPIACIKRRRIKTNMDFAKASKAAEKAAHHRGWNKPCMTRASPKKNGRPKAADSGKGDDQKR